MSVYVHKHTCHDNYLLLSNYHFRSFSVSLALGFLPSERLTDTEGDTLAFLASIFFWTCLTGSLEAAASCLLSIFVAGLRCGEVCFSGSCNPSVRCLEGLGCSAFLFSFLVEFGGFTPGFFGLPKLYVQNFVKGVH
ncbi:Uncharacterised protein [Chlamydia trachomatis]|nr:Uncharacterised protein [Chlamydia trachomatis]